VPVVLVHEGLTQAQYEDSVRKLTGGKERVDSPADWPVDGLLVHVTGAGGPTGFRVVDVWESEDAARRFGEQLAPVMQELGIEAAPEIYPAHTFVSA
jgi:hypothetical protein